MLMHRAQPTQEIVCGGPLCQCTRHMAVTMPPAAQHAHHGACCQCCTPKGATLHIRMEQQPGFMIFSHLVHTGNFYAATGSGGSRLEQTCLSGNYQCSCSHRLWKIAVQQVVESMRASSSSVSSSSRSGLLRLTRCQHRQPARAPGGMEYQSPSNSRSVASCATAAAGRECSAHQKQKGAMGCKCIFPFRALIDAKPLHAEGSTIAGSHQAARTKRAVVAIDGPAACGKGTLSKAIATAFNLAHLVRCAARASENNSNVCAISPAELLTTSVVAGHRPAVPCCGLWCCSPRHRPGCRGEPDRSVQQPVTRGPGRPWATGGRGGTGSVKSVGEQQAGAGPTGGLPTPHTVRAGNRAQAAGGMATC